MKTQFKSIEIAHIWANKSAQHGSSPGAMSFNGPAFLSYGTVIAWHIEHKGKPAVILNNTRYSVTTSKHQQIVRSALPGDVPVFHTSIGRGDSPSCVTGEDLFKYAVGSAADMQAKAEKARTMKGRHEADAARWLTEAQSVSEFFGLRRKVNADTIARLRASSAAAERKATAVEEKRLAGQRAEQYGAFDAWLSGQDGGYFSHSAFPVAFRMEKDELVSTLGARVPLVEARIAYRFAIAMRATGWHRNGEIQPVGNYQLDAINAQGIVAGCHRIPWSEIERLSPVLG